MTTKYAPEEMRRINASLDTFADWLRKHPDYRSGVDSQLDAEHDRLMQECAKTCACFHRGEPKKQNGSDRPASTPTKKENMT